MSDRGSFVTEYIYCTECFDVIYSHLSKHDCIEYLTNINGVIIAGKLRGLGSGDEIRDIKRIAKDIQIIIKCNISIAILPDSYPAEIINIISQLNHQ